MSQCQDGVKLLKYHDSRCQGIKDTLEKYTKEHLKKDFNRYFVEKFRKSRTEAEIYALNFSVRGVLDRISNHMHDCERIFSPMILIKGSGNY